MSEYQYFAFRAVDGPVSSANLKYMRRQSTRAEITPWSFDNEYHFGDFSGNTLEMLQRGYDIHLHFAIYGTLKLMFYLPRGLPDQKQAKPYLEQGALDYAANKKKGGGILTIDPYYEPFDDRWDDDWDTMLNSLAPLRDELMGGDLRPLYIASLAVRTDDDHDPEEELEGPVPAGLDKLTPAQRSLANCYNLDKDLLTVAARKSPPLPAGGEQGAPNKWIASLPVAKKNEWLTKCLSQDAAEVRREMLAEYSAQQVPREWPTNPAERTIAMLQEEADVLRDRGYRKRAAAEEAKQKKQLAKMANNPESFLKQVDKLVAQQSVAAYREASKLLHELQDALREKGQNAMVEAHARRLTEKYPTRTRLLSELRREGILKK